MRSCHVIIWRNVLMIGRQSCLSVLGVVFCTPVCAPACVTKLPHQKDLPHRHLGCALFIFYYFIINIIIFYIISICCTWLYITFFFWCFCCGKLGCMLKIESLVLELYYAMSASLCITQTSHIICRPVQINIEVTKDYKWAAILG